MDAAHFACFDYAALGHLHGAQNCSGTNENRVIRYSGTPLAYSIAEADDEKSVTVVELLEKGSITVRTCPITPARRICRLRGRYETLMSRAFYEDSDYRASYVQITLTDEEDIVDAIGKLRTVYHNLMKLDYDNKRTSSVSQVDGAADVETKTPIELFSDFYELQNNQPMSNEQKAFVEDLIDQVWEDEK